MSLAIGSEALSTNSFTSAATGASASFIGKNNERNGLLVCADPANTGPVYLLLYSGVGTAPTATVTNWHIPLAAGGSWGGLVSGTVWWGGVVAFSAAAQRISILEV